MPSLPLRLVLALGAVGAIVALALVADSAGACAAYFDGGYGYQQYSADFDSDGLNESIVVYGNVRGNEYVYVNVTLADELSGWPIDSNSTGLIFANAGLFGGTNYNVSVTVSSGLPAGSYVAWVYLANESTDCENHQLMAVPLNPLGAYDLQVSANVTDGTAEESGSATYEWNVTNAGNNPDNVTFSWYPPPGWTASASPEVLPLGVGETGTVNITIAAPHNAAPLYTNHMTIYATSSRNPNVFNSTTFNTTIVAQRFAIAATPRQGEATAPPGGTLNLTWNVTNLGNNRDNISLLVSAPPFGWSASLSAAYIFLDAGENQTVTLTVTVPVALTGAITWTATVEATAGDRTTSASTSLNASVALPDFSVVATDLALENSAPTEGDSVGVDVTVRNLGTPLALDILVRLSDGHANLSKTVSVAVTGTGVASFAWTATLGTTQLTVTVDASNAVPEAREDNNAASVAVTVKARNVAPAAAVVNATATGQVGQAVTVSAAASSDPDGTVAAYFFDFGDGNQSGWVTTPAVSHTYGAAGTYTVKVRVRDDAGAESTNATSTVTIAAQSAPPPKPSTPGFELSTALACTGLAAALCLARRRRSE